MSENPVRIGKVTPKGNLALLPDLTVTRSRGVVTMVAPDENGNPGQPWGRITVDFFDYPRDLMNSDMIYALESAKAVVIKNGFFYGYEEEK